MALDTANADTDNGGHNNSWYYNECIPCPDGICNNVNAAFTFGEGITHAWNFPCDGDSYYNPMLNECRSCFEETGNCSSCTYYECSDCGAPGYFLGCNTCATGYHLDDDSTPALCTSSTVCATGM
jgi:hypothetical protein